MRVIASVATTARLVNTAMPTQAMMVHAILNKMVPSMANVRMIIIAISVTIWARRAMLMRIVGKVVITLAIVVDKVMELNITNGVTTLHRLPRHHMNNLSATISDKHVIEIVIVTKAVLILVRHVVAI